MSARRKEELLSSPATIGAKVVAEKVKNGVIFTMKVLFMPAFMMTVTSDREWHLSVGEAGFFEAFRLAVSGATAALGSEALKRTSLDFGHILIAATAAFTLAGLVDFSGLVLQAVGQRSKSKN